MGYKANRLNASNLDDREIALSQIPELKRAMRGLGLRNYTIKGLEADDLIGIMATAIIGDNIFDEVIIHSADTDFYQFLVGDEIKILNGIDGNTGDLLWVDGATVVMEYNIHPRQWTCYRAITGDKSDNIPQMLVGVGPAKALKLLRAGVDASLGRHEASPAAIQALQDMTKGQIDVDEFWRRLRKNLRACQIMTINDRDVPCMDAEVQEKISELVAGLCRKVLCRNEEGMGTEAYREFCAWCGQHGMVALRARAGEFGTFL